MNNHAVDKQLNISWNGQILQNDHYLKYLGVTLDRALLFAKHTQNVKAKVAARNNIHGKLETPPGEQILTPCRQQLWPSATRQQNMPHMYGLGHAMQKRSTLH